MATTTAKRTKLTGTFDVSSWEEDAYREAGGEPKLTHVLGSQAFSGDIAGDGTIAWLMCYRPDGSARFVGLQHISGTFGDRQGSIVIESVGDHDGKTSRGTWTVVDGSGTGDLDGVAGRGSFSAPGGRTVEYELELE